MFTTKADFIKAMQTLLKNTEEYADVYSIDYVSDATGEWLYVTYKSYSQKRICVNGDSNSAMLFDFLSKVNRADWLSGDDVKRGFFPD